MVKIEDKKCICLYHKNFTVLIYEFVQYLTYSSWRSITCMDDLILVLDYTYKLQTQPSYVKNEPKIPAFCVFHGI